MNITSGDWVRSGDAVGRVLRVKHTYAGTVCGFVVQLHPDPQYADFDAGAEAWHDPNNPT